MSQQDIKVIFIGGCGRSGSTLLDRVLGQTRGVFSLGEMYHIWERGFLYNQLCGCGRPFHSCDFWRSVGDELFRATGVSGIEGIFYLHRSVARFRHLPWLLFQDLRSRRFQERMDQYIQILRVLYSAIADVSGCRVLIDSSKLPMQGLLLNEIQGIRLFVLHLIRDSRAVAYSWRRRRLRPETRSGPSFMPRRGPIQSSLEWVLLNTFTLFLATKASEYMAIKYEQLCSDPKTTLLRITDRIGLEAQPLDLSGKRGLVLEKNHTVSGNPMRFKAGRLDIRLDDQWRRDMPAYQKALVMALTRPYVIMERLFRTRER